MRWPPKDPECWTPEVTTYSVFPGLFTRNCSTSKIDRSVHRADLFRRVVLWPDGGTSPPKRGKYRHKRLKKSDEAGGEHSPRRTLLCQFPAKQGKYREFFRFWPASGKTKRRNHCEFDETSGDKPESRTGKNKELSGNQLNNRRQSHWRKSPQMPVRQGDYRSGKSFDRTGTIG